MTVTKRVVYGAIAARAMPELTVGRFRFFLLRKCNVFLGSR